MSRHDTDAPWVQSDTELRNSCGAINLMVKVVTDHDLPFDVCNEINRYRTGFESVLIHPFYKNGEWKTWKNDSAHATTILVLLISPDRRHGMKISYGDEFTLLGVRAHQPYRLDGGHEILLIEALQSPDSVIIRHPKNSDHRIVFDAYSGFGGWAKGGDIVGAAYKVFWEIDPEIANVCSRNTGTHLLHTDQILAMTHDAFRHHLSMGVTINGDFGNIAVWEYLCQSGVDWGSMSLPCPSWSRLSTERGLDDVRGGEHHTLLHFARCAQPLLLVLENVDALLKHRHWIEVKTKFVELGFHLVHVGSDSLQKVMPMSRNRACIIVANRAYASEFRTFDLGPTEFPPLDYAMNPRSSGFIHEFIPHELMSFIVIDPEDRAILCDKKVWPNDWGYVARHGSIIPLKDRVHPKSQILPCAVAKYASPRDISRNLLETKGLFMKIMQQAEESGDSWFYRWISPFEQMASMGFPFGTLIPNVKALAYHVVGNSIAVPHSIISLLRVYELLPQTFLTTGKKNLFEALIDMKMKVGRINDMDLKSDDEYLWLSPINMIPREIPILSTAVDDSTVHSGNSPATQQEVEEIGRLITAEDTRDRFGGDHQTPNEIRNPLEVSYGGVADFAIGVEPRLKGCIPEAPFLFSPEEIKHVFQRDVIYNRKSLAVCVPQIVFSTVYREPKIHEGMKDTTIDPISSSTVVHLRTLDGTWTWEGQTTTPCITIGVLILTALPHARPDLIDNITLAGTSCRWETMITTSEHDKIQVVFTPKFVARLFKIAPTDTVCPVLCDICDTPDTLVHAILYSHKECGNDLVMLQAGSLIHADEYILAHPMHTFILKTSDRNEDCRVAAIHPITGRFHEIVINKRSTIRAVQFLIAPDLPESVHVIAEINHRRVAIDTPVEHLEADQVVRFRCFPLQGGVKGDIRGQLREQLTSHGVPDNVVLARIHTITTAIQEAQLAECFRQNDPWGALKNLCTSASIRLVQPQELKDRQTTMRTNTRKNEAKGGSKGTGKGKASLDLSKHSPLLPPLVENVDFHSDFQGTDGATIPLICPAAMCTGGTGVCPMNLQQAKSFLPVSVISPDPLAILVLGHHDSLSDHKLTVAGTLKSTNMPCLLPATLIQFGASPVDYKFTGLKVEVNPIESHIIEVVISKDRCKHWDTNVAPIDIVAKYLPTVKDKSILIGTWGWKPLDQAWKQSHATMASFWKGFIRVTSTAVEEMLRSSGPGGISLWPKDNEYKPHQDFAHLAVHADDEIQAQACAQKIPQHLGFVCHRGRFLLRCRRTHFNSVKKVLNPDGCILDACEINPTDLRFVLTGLTEGFAADSITEGLKNAGWNARTVRALSAKTWLLVSSQPPKETHLQINGTLVTVRPFQKDAPVRPIENSFRRDRPNAMALSHWNDDRSTASTVSSFGQGPIANKLDEITAKLNQTTEQIGTLTEQMQMMSERQDIHETQVSSKFEQVEQHQQAFNSKLEGAIVNQMKHMFSTFEGNISSRLDRIESEISEDGDKRRKVN